MSEISNYQTKEEIRRFFGVIKNPRDRAIFFILYFQGLRASEPGRLQMADYDPVEHRLMIRRRKRSRTSNPQLSPQEIRALTAWLKQRGRDPGPIFRTSPKKTRGIDRTTMHVLVRKYAAKAKIPIEKAHSHIFKHSIATHLLQSGVPIEKVQIILGHKKITSTAEYLHIANPEIDDVARKFASESVI